jgi:hypothetical protein
MARVFLSSPQPQTEERVTSHVTRTPQSTHTRYTYGATCTVYRIPTCRRTRGRVDHILYGGTATSRIGPPGGSVHSRLPWSEPTDRFEAMSGRLAPPAVGWAPPGSARGADRDQPPHPPARGRVRLTRPRVDQVHCTSPPVTVSSLSLIR